MHECEVTNGTSMCAGLTPLLQVYDMPTSVRFYREVLGFQVVSTSPKFGPDRFHWAMLRLGDAELMLNTAYESDEERPAVPEATRVAAHDDTGLFLGCANVDEAYEEPVSYTHLTLPTTR